MRTLAVVATLPLTMVGLVAQPVVAADQTADFSIVNGTEVSATAFPDVVNLQVPTSSGYISCGGTIINDQWVVSAAHCLEERQPSRPVVVRTYLGTQQDSFGRINPQEHLSTRIVSHPRYAPLNAAEPFNPNFGQFDVALIKVDSSFTRAVHDFNTSQGTGQSSAITTLVRAGSALPRVGTGTVVGRGASYWKPEGGYGSETNRLAQADIEIQSECSSDTLICAGAEMTPPTDTHANVHHDTEYRYPASCEGDSGGPLFVTQDGVRTQVGIVSHSRQPATMTVWGSDTCGRYKTWYTAIAFVRPWIDAVLQSTDSYPIPNPLLPIPPYGAGSSTSNQNQPVQPPQSGQGNGQDHQPPAPGQPVTPSPTPTPSEGPIDGTLPAHPDDPAILKAIPAPSDGSMAWHVSIDEPAAGSELALGINRLRNAFTAYAQRPGKSTNDGTSRLALLASETTMADALASGVLQQDAPLFLTDPQALEPLVLKELQATKVKQVWLLGGEKALSPAVETALREAGFTTRRIAGHDRTQTAVEIAKAKAELHANVPNARFMARAYGDAGDETRSWADALALGGLAAHTGYPILLTGTTTLPTGLDQQLQQGTSTTVIGGPAAIAEQVVNQIQSMTNVQPNRLAGLNRADTAGLIAKQFETANRAIVIDGQSPNAWQLGFSLAGLSADLKAPIMLTLGTTVPEETRNALAEMGLEHVICMGELPVCEAVTEVTNVSVMN